MPISVGLKKKLIVRQNDDGEFIDYHKYPFDTLPKIQTHLHPKFVIFDAGKKWKKAEGFSLEPQFKHLETSLETIEGLYDAWIRPLPKSKATNDK